MQRELELSDRQEYKAPTKADHAKVNTEDAPRFIESIPAFLDGTWGNTGIPFRYVERPNIKPSQEDMDPGFDKLGLHVLGS